VTGSKRKGVGQTRTINDGLPSSAILDLVPTPIFLLHHDGVVVLANAAAKARLFETPPSRTEISLGKLLGARHPLSVLFERAIADQSDITGLGIAIHVAGRSEEVFDVEVAFPHKPELCLITCLPQGRNARGTLTADAGNVLRGVTRALAHEVRNPLAGIRGAAQLLMRSTSGDERELATVIRDEADRIERLTERVETLDMMAAPRFASVSVHPACERAATLLRSAFPNVSIHEHYDPSLPEIELDADQMIQALLNLGKNGAEAVGGRGSVTIETRYKPGLKLRSHRSAAAHSVLEISVTDTGPGLSPDRVTNLFTPFVTTKPGGMGLGLVITSEIVSRHGGRLDVESRPGRTKFAILLPIVPVRSNG
jgi:two-component system, NtrC family, nitrogen regulation sensor histidine kinase GlnL